eukprot:1183741-Prorocentrum_minimum.AAC.4
MAERGHSANAIAGDPEHLFRMSETYRPPRDSQQARALVEQQHWVAGGLNVCQQYISGVSAAGLR